MTTQPIEILLVEDDPNDIELILLALKEQNIANRIHVVRDGEEALEFLFREGKYKESTHSFVPKCVFLDLKLPKIEGLEVLKRLRADNRTRFIPVAILTSSREERDIVKSYALGVNSYIVKPINFENFMRVVKDLGMYWVLYNETPHNLQSYKGESS